MKERSFDEMIAYFNRRVSEMDIAQDYKMELLGMVTALGYKHEKTAQQWIPVEKKLPNDNEKVIAMGSGGGIYIAIYNHPDWWDKWYKVNDRHHYCDPVAWCPLPESHEEERGE